MNPRPRPSTPNTAATTPATQDQPTAPCVTTHVTTICAWCGTSMTAEGRRRWCSDACKQAAWRARRATPAIPRKVPRIDTIYQCPACETRYLGQQRCDTCNLFCRSLGPGAPCPHCDDPVALSDLIEPQ
jgi:hypothetical protein